MKIILENETAIILRAWTKATENEFSGVADVVRKDGDLLVSNAHILDLGSYGYTDFTPAMQLALPASQNRRCWFHRHPITCWSGTDIHTMTVTPMGTLPELINWAVAIVWTPAGWLGRLDMFIGPHRHFDLEVVEAWPQETIEAYADSYCKTSRLVKRAKVLHQDFIKRHNRDWDMEESSFLPVHNKVVVDALGEKLRVASSHITHTQKTRKNLLQRTFDWLLDKPKED
jgi:hypothetical protein